MNKPHAEIRFEKARKRLSAALKNLEEVVKEKMHEESINATMIGASNNDGADAKVIELENVIQKLHGEINNLQKNLSEVGKETDFLNEKNKVLTKKLSDFRTQGLNLVETIAADLAHIEEVIKNYDN